MDLLRYEKEHGKIVWVMGPAFSFDYDARNAMQSLIENGYAHGLMAGNALATHDLEGALLHTALGQDIYTQVSQPNGHYNHLDVINKVRRSGSIAQFIEDYHIDNGIMYSIVKNKIPFVIVGAPVDYKDETTYVDNDNQLMAETAVTYLNQKGHNQILFVTNDQESDVYIERFIGYQKGMQVLGLQSYDSALFDSKQASTLEAFVKTVQKKRITALLIIGDVVSLRIIQFLSYYGIAVPEDMSIVSFNNSSYATILHPYLTTFDIIVNRLGRASLNCLLEKVQKRQSKDQKVIVPFTLKKRESVRNLKKS